MCVDTSLGASSTSGRTRGPPQHTQDVYPNQSPCQSVCPSQASPTTCISFPSVPCVPLPGDSLRPSCSLQTRVCPSPQTTVDTRNNRALDSHKQETKDSRVLHVLEHPHPRTYNVEIGSCVTYRFTVILHHKKVKPSSKQMSKQTQQTNVLICFLCLSPRAVEPGPKSILKKRGQKSSIKERKRISTRKEPQRAHKLVANWPDLFMLST